MKTIPNSRPLHLDDLPKFSSWIPNIFEFNSIQIAKKNVTNILREYGEDKWGALQKQILANPDVTVVDADSLFLGESKPSAYYLGGLYLASSTDVQEAYYRLILNEVLPHIVAAGHLVELGAGYGSQLLKIAALPELSHAGFTAGEYTKTGVDCIKLLAERQSLLHVNAVQCDLNSLNLSSFAIPSRAVFMTCWTMAYLKGFPRSAIEEILRKKPSMVIHVEPIFEHWSNSSLLHLMWKKYVKINDYNQTFMTELKEYETAGAIKIIEERPHVFGPNPLAPVSIVKWVPCE